MMISRGTLLQNLKMLKFLSKIFNDFFGKIKIKEFFSANYKHFCITNVNKMF